MTVPAVPLGAGGRDDGVPVAMPLSGPTPGYRGRQLLLGDIAVPAWEKQNKQPRLSPRKTPLRLRAAAAAVLCAGLAGAQWRPPPGTTTPRLLRGAASPPHGGEGGRQALAHAQRAHPARTPFPGRPSARPLAASLPAARNAASRSVTRPLSVVTRKVCARHSNRGRRGVCGAERRGRGGSGGDSAGHRAGTGRRAGGRGGGVRGAAPPPPPPRFRRVGPGRAGWRPRPPRRAGGGGRLRP